ncbi:hypothetical protein C8R44DRAFT_619864, partial [Mycena epipterygia]
MCSLRVVETSAIPDPKIAFWDAYKEVADEYDRNLEQKYGTDLDNALLFAGLFSAVSSAFIIQIQPELQPDPNVTNQALMRLLIHTTNPSIFSDSDAQIPTWTGPPVTIVVVQSLLYTSLFSTLLVALIAVLGKQWLLYYTGAGETGTIQERGRDRQRKFEGLVRWKFDAFMKAFPL